ncbi:unnamed protein product, partial [Urochloa humidicola]
RRRRGWRRPAWGAGAARHESVPLGGGGGGAAVEAAAGEADAPVAGDGAGGGGCVAGGDRAAAAWREGTGRHGSRPAAAVPDAAAGAPLPLGQAPPRSRSPTDAMAAPSSAAGVAAVVGVLVLLVAGVSGARLPARGAAILGAALPRGGASGGPSRRSGAFPASYAPASPRPTPSTCNLAQHAECVKVEYDPRLIEYRQLLYVFWASHDPREVFGQGSDVGNQYRSVIVGGLQTLAVFNKHDDVSKSSTLEGRAEKEDSTARSSAMVSENKKRKNY